MKRILTILILGIFFLATATAIVTLSNGDKLISESELETKTDQDIQNYFQNNLVCFGKDIIGDRLRVRCNITYLEPTHQDYTYNDSNNITQIVVAPYRSFTQLQNFFIPLSLWEKCKNKTTKENCAYHLLNSTTTYYLIETIDNETTNTTIKSVYLQAQEEQIRQFNRAKEFRDNAISDPLDDLEEMI